MVGVDKRTCVDITTIDDDQREAEEFFTVTFTPVTSVEDEFGSGGPLLTVIIRDDNDGKYIL